MPVMEKPALSAEEILKSAEKIQQNVQEQKAFETNLHSLLNGDKRIASKPLIVGTTTNALAICGADGDLPLTITKKVIDKAMRPEMRDEQGVRNKKSGHFLTEQQIADSLNSVKEPVMILRGSQENSLVAVTEFTDNKDQEIIVPIELSKNGSVEDVNAITSIYGREEFAEYLKNNIRDENILAINTEKADKLLLSIGVDFPKANTVISFDNSIAYTTANVKYPEKNISENTSEEIQEDQASDKFWHEMSYPCPFGDSQDDDEELDLTNHSGLSR